MHGNEIVTDDEGCEMRGDSPWQAGLAIGYLRLMDRVCEI
jgi:hypothetical protein